MLWGVDMAVRDLVNSPPESEWEEDTIVNMRNFLLIEWDANCSSAEWDHPLILIVLSEVTMNKNHFSKVSPFG